MGKKTVNAVPLGHRESWTTIARRELCNNWLLFVMLLPAVVYVVIFAYWPMSGIVLAFKDYRTRLGIFGSPWVGMLNFEFLGISGKLGLLTWNTLSYNIIFIVLSVILEKGLQPPMSVSGYAFQLNVALDSTSILDEAPTFAPALEISLPHAEGRALWELLKKAE